MKRSILFPLETRSANTALRGLADAETARKIAMAKVGATKRERKVTGAALRAVGFGPPPDVYAICAGLDITIVRVAVGTLDYPANLGVALKGPQDEIAAWLGISDKDPRVDWHFRQAKCERSTTKGIPSYQGVRIEIICNGKGPDIDMRIGPGPARIGPATKRGDGDLPAKEEHANDPRRRADRARIATAGASPALPRSEPRAYVSPEQLALPGRPVYAALPWEQSGDGLPELTELRLDGNDPPAQIRVDVPPLVRDLHQHSKRAILRLAGRVVWLERHLVRCAELGEVWVYAERGAAEMAFFEPARPAAARSTA